MAAADVVPEGGDAACIREEDLPLRLRESDALLEEVDESCTDGDIAVAAGLVEGEAAWYEGVVVACADVTDGVVLGVGDAACLEGVDAGCADVASPVVLGGGDAFDLPLRMGELDFPHWVGDD